MSSPLRRLIAVLVALVLLVAGCSNDDSGADGTPTAAAGWPVSIEHKFGTATITKKPERIVTARWNDQPAL